MKKMNMKKLDSESILPTRAHPEDAGLDLYNLESFVLEPGQGHMARTGIAMAIPQGYVGLVADRSSLGKKGLKTLGGVIDAGYRGEVKVLIRNLSLETLQLEAGDRIAQLLILPVQTPEVVEVEDLDETVRGMGGFGSTGN